MRRGQAITITITITHKGGGSGRERGGSRRPAGYVRAERNPFVGKAGEITSGYKQRRRRRRQQQQQQPQQQQQTRRAYLNASHGLRQPVREGAEQAQAAHVDERKRRPVEAAGNVQPHHRGGEPVQRGGDGEDDQTGEQAFPPPVPAVQLRSDRRSGQRVAGRGGAAKSLIIRCARCYKRTSNPTDSTKEEEGEEEEAGKIQRRRDERLHP